MVTYGYGCGQVGGNRLKRAGRTNFIGHELREVILLGNKLQKGIIDI